MAEIKYYEEKVQKATEKVEKCKGTIARHEKALAKKIDVVVKLGIDPQNLDASKWNKNGGGGSEFYWEICDVERKQDDIKGATRKLKDAEAILKNWQEKLQIEINKEIFLEGNAPQVIKDFLEEWKVMAHEWHIKRYNNYQILKKELEEKRKKAYKELGIKEDRFPNREQEKALKELELDYKSIQATKANFAGGAVMHMDTIRNEAERLAWLEKTLEADKKAKMLDLITRINDVVGTITDATNLKIKVGNLNGIIIGEKGKAKVETISAGGWNIQVFHFRTLVHPIKEKV